MKTKKLDKIEFLIKDPSLFLTKVGPTCKIKILLRKLFYILSSIKAY